MSKTSIQQSIYLAIYSSINTSINTSINQSLSQSVNCLLRWLRNKDSPTHGAIAGGLAGACLAFYRSVTIALYAATKLIEVNNRGLAILEKFYRVSHILLILSFSHTWVIFDNNVGWCNTSYFYYMSLYMLADGLIAQSQCEEHLMPTQHVTKVYLD